MHELYLVVFGDAVAQGSIDQELLIEKGLVSMEAQVNTAMLSQYLLH